MQRAVVAAIAICVSSCGGDAVDQGTGEAAVEVVFQSARYEAIRDAVIAPGIVVPAASGEQTVVAGEAGEIVELPKGEGDQVAEGDLLVRLEVASITAEIALRQQEHAEALARLDRAKADTARQAPLFERGLLSRVAFEAIKSAEYAAQSAADQATARLKAAHAQTERTTVRARMAGTVTRRWHVVGDFVSPDLADPIIRVVDRSRVQVAARVPLAQIDRFQPGQTALLPSPLGPPEPLIMQSRSATQDPAATTAEVRFAFVQPTTLPLDTDVQVEVVFAERARALVVPAIGVLRDGAGSYVWIGADDLRAHRRDVRIGIQAGTLVEVLTGLAEGDRVVTSGMTQLAPNVLLTVR